jgi:Trk K+ transport system NAD-binding subunit
MKIAIVGADDVGRSLGAALKVEGTHDRLWHP